MSSVKMSSIYLIAIFCASVPVTTSSAPGEVIQVHENFKGPFPWYLAKIELSADGWEDAKLAGDEDGIFDLDPKTGFLRILQPFDREKRTSYTVTVTGGQETVTVNIEVVDENDNAPIFSKRTFHGIVSRGSRAGVSFLHIVATDADDPATENADLRYKIVQVGDGLFQIDPRTGAVSLTEEGVTYLSERDVRHFILLVQVTDLGGSPRGLSDSASLEIIAAENSWKAPSSVSIHENHKGDYPLIIAKCM
ncbi:cadherin-16 [Hyperolius riggenbachi]|uniref:cadherin-16 n=1 Tax=Hyperolius riggenbachi TaxID=752182 RepID=UPI0035A374D0